MKKFILCVGCEKGGTTWLHQYLSKHPEYHDPGKELNAVQRDDIVPSFCTVSKAFQEDIYNYQLYFSNVNKVSGDFTHYEGSTANLFRILKQNLNNAGYDVIPVYIMRDPIQRAWSAFNMLGAGPIIPGLSTANFFLRKNLECKYKETIQALDTVFEEPMYFFYETFFEEANIKSICDSLGIDFIPPNLERVINKGTYTELPSTHFVSLFGKTTKNIEAVDFIKERFNNVPWNLESYKKI